MKQFVVIALVAVLAAGYVLRDRLAPLAPSWAQSYLAASAGPAKTGPAAGGKRGGGGPVAVRVVAASMGTLPVQRSTIGSVVPVASTQLASQISGTLAQILVQDGATVKQGDLLVKLDDSTIRAQIAKDEAQIAKDQATLDDAQASYNRTKHLVDTGVSAAQAGDDALTAVKVAQGTLAVDTAAHAADEVALRNTEIRAPFDGRLGAVQYSQGAYVSAGTALVRITRMKPVLVQFSLAADDLALLRRTFDAGTLTVGVTAVGDPAATPETGAVTFIDNAVDGPSATVTLRASLANDNGRLWPGQPVSVALQAGLTQPLVLVPNVAVMPTDKGEVAYVVTSDNKIDQRPVTVALRVGDQAGVSSGLKAGDRVVVEGQAAIFPGATVKVVTASAGAANATRQGQAELAAPTSGEGRKS